LIRYDKDKNSKPIFYMKGIINFLLPHNNFFLIQKRKTLLEKYKNDKLVLERVNYYNKTSSFQIDESFISIKEFYKTKKKTYFFDLLKYLKYFNSNLKFKFLFGDITHIPNEPTIVKSRPINDINQNSVIMKLNTVRHFIFVDDTLSFEEKLPKAVWRGKCYKKHREDFVQQYYSKTFCDIGQTNTKGDISVAWQKNKMSIEEQLKYKYLIAIEGNDVASNLKWAMSSNSLVMMAKPKFETWFMEGRLQEGYHYVLLKDDYSDLEEKINFYNQHPDKAQKIIEQAHLYINQFLNHEIEDAISIMILEKYFKNSQQL